MRRSSTLGVLAAMLLLAAAGSPRQQIIAASIDPLVVEDHGRAGVTASASLDRGPTAPPPAKPQAAEPTPSAGTARSFCVGIPGEPGARVCLDKGHDLALLVEAKTGDTIGSLAERLLERGVPATAIQSANPGRPILRAGSWYRVPFAALTAEWRVRVLRAAFPKDGPSPKGWVHRPASSPLDTYGEGAWQAAQWFTGSGENFGAILEANALSDPLFGRGKEIVIPADILLEELPGLWQTGQDPGHGRASQDGKGSVARPARSGSEGGLQEADAPDRDNVVASSADTAETSAEDPSEDAGVHGTTRTSEKKSAPGRSGSGLVFSKDSLGEYAAYRLKPGEALYSSVVIRFTGRVDPDEVAEAADVIARRNGIRSVTRIPAGSTILIPRSMVLPEFLPADDPHRQAVEAVRKEAAKIRNPVRSRNLAGIHVILDAGHGGVDPGAIVDGIVEHEYVYDVMCRVKRILERETSAIVHPLIEDPSSGFVPRQERTLRVSGRETILTSPEHVNEAPGETALGVNLRWYLANSILRRMVTAGVDPTKAVFVSFHADVLHPSLRGAMIYVPGERYRRGSYGRGNSECSRYAEVREAPSVRFSRDDRVVSEGLSRQFAGQLVSALAKRGIRVHPYQPVRDRIIRRGRAWLPAVLRGNSVPVKILLEIGNLNNAGDRTLMRSAAFRESVARAFTDALLAYYRTPAPVAERVAEGRPRP